jgi:cytochrome c
MDSFEINKILGALLAVLTFIVGLGIIAEVIFEQEAPEKPGFAVEVAASNEGSGGQAAVEEKDPPVESLLASADSAKGETLFRACVACHTIDKGGPNRVGPNLYGVVGGEKTHKEDFNYSKAMKDAAAKGPWDYAALYEYLKNPKAYIPGNAMAYAGLRKPKDRADLIAYLRSKSDNPPPLPK